MAPITSQRRWCYTINNPSESDVAAVENFFDHNSSVIYHVYGREVGSNGTPHIQGFFCLNRTNRLSWCAAHISSRAHFEQARGTSTQASDYCKKDGDFVEHGVCPSETRNQYSNSDVESARLWIVDFIDEFKRCPTNRELALAHGKAFVHAGPKLLSYAEAIAPPPVLDREEEELQLYDWQKGLLDLLNEPSDDRQVLVVQDVIGNTGKSWFARYMLCKKPQEVQILGIGKRDDIAYMLNPTKSIFFFDVPRGSIGHLQWSIIEMIKNGLVHSNKYLSQTKQLKKRVHVVVLTNELIDQSVLSLDRWKFIYADTIITN